MNTSRLLANRKPQLNAYQLACGYLQVRSFPVAMRKVTLWHESAHYHVRTTHENNPHMVGFTTWNTFDTLAEARAEFKSQCDVCKHLIG